MVFSGRVTKEKGVSELIDVMIQLKQYEKIKLLIIGSSFYGDAIHEDSFIKALKQKAEIIKERIIFTGFIPYSQMPQYLKISDISVVPSLWMTHVQIQFLKHRRWDYLLSLHDVVESLKR